MDSQRIRAVIPGLQVLAREVFMERERRGGNFNWRKWWLSNGLDAQEIFGYVPQEGMQSISSLINPHFHPRLPLVGFNYTPSAHYSLHHFKNGWTDAIRVCRGIIFDKEGNLIAFPFPKFFNLNEHPETKLENLLFNEGFEVIEKMDGHLGIVYVYDDKLHLATRGSFVSESARIGKEMLRATITKQGRLTLINFCKFNTVCVEIIHPETFVQVRYDMPQVKLIGCRELGGSCFDASWSELKMISGMVDNNLSLPTLWSGRRLYGKEKFDNLLTHIHDLSVENKEGYVVNFVRGLRVKVKFLRYIQELKANKFNIAVLMRAYVAGELEKAIDILPEELRGDAQETWKDVERAVLSSERFNEQKLALYSLPRGDLSENYFRQICRRFLAVRNKRK